MPTIKWSFLIECSAKTNEKASFGEHKLEEAIMVAGLAFCL